MARKLEHWRKELFKQYSGGLDEPKSERHLTIIAASILDLALVNLLEKRLVRIQSEQENFLGLSEDGRAPAGSFGARIQVALLCGCISVDEAAALRAFKEIRNRFAHRVNLDFNDVKVLGQMGIIYNYLLKAMLRYTMPSGERIVLTALGEYTKDYGERERLIQLGMCMLQETLRIRLAKLKRLAKAKELL